MNVTVIAKNAYENFTQLLTFEIVGKVKGPLIDDYQIISNKAQEKEFEISFETIGSGSCMVVDFKDGSMKVNWTFSYFIFFDYLRVLVIQLTAQSGSLMSSTSQFCPHSQIFRRFTTPTSKYITHLVIHHNSTLMPFCHCQQLWYFQCVRAGQEPGDGGGCVWRHYEHRHRGKAVWTNILNDTYYVFYRLRARRQNWAFHLTRLTPWSLRSTSERSRLSSTPTPSWTVLPW